MPIFKENLHNFNFPYHPNFNTHNPVNKSADFKKTKYLTVLRDPVERVYSLFIDVLANRKHSLNHLAKKGLEIFCMNSWEVKNMYVRYFSGNIFKDDENHYSKAIGNLNEFYKIFNFHDLEKDIDIFLEKEKNLKIDLKNYKTKKYNKIISDSDREIIKKFNYLDLKLFKKMTMLYWNTDKFRLNEEGSGAQDNRTPPLKLFFNLFKNKIVLLIGHQKALFNYEWRTKNDKTR